MREIIGGDYALYLGDAMEIMKDLAGAARCIVTDPPYLLTSGGATGGMMRGCLDPENYDNGGGIVGKDIPGWGDFMPLLYDCLKRQGHCYTMANNRNVSAMLNAADAAGFGFHNLLVWDKRTATMNRWYMKNCEFTGFFYKGLAYEINDCGSKQLVSVPQVDVSGTWAEDGVPHPTEKPVMLMEHYIRNSTQPGDVVLDPFMGSGTTGEAALRCGRRFIGIERDEKIFNMAAGRMGSLTKRHANNELFACY